jgi:hypothetical protein
MKLFRTYSFLLLWLIAFGARAEWFPEMQRKGNFFGGWGWNRAAYTKSDIHFTGEGYDFTLHKVHAKDRQTQFEAKTYFGLKTLTIPQTNIKLGYFIHDRIAITIGVDHMKYVMVQNQHVAFEGNISDATYMNMVNDNSVKLTPEFLTFEHTDGLNYLLTELEFYQGIFSGSFLDVNAYGGAGVGALMPKSNVKLMGYPRNDEFHFAGFGTNVKCGAEVLLGNHFYVRGEAKCGYINMPDIITRAASISDRASQQFGFAAIDFMIGFNITPRKSRTQTTENTSPTAG